MQPEKIKSANIESAPVKATRSINHVLTTNRVAVYFWGVITTVVCGSFMFFASQATEEANTRAFIITPDQTVSAKNALSDPNSRRVEIENHAKLFLSSMYAFDQNTYEKNIKKGLKLIGDDGRIILAEYNKMGLHNKLSQLNLSITVEIDSIWVKMDTSRPSAYVFARQTQETSVSRNQNFLWCTMEFRSLKERSQDNVHGLLIENLQIKNKDVIN